MIVFVVLPLVIVPPLTVHVYPVMEASVTYVCVELKQTDWGPLTVGIGRGLTVTA